MTDGMTILLFQYFNKAMWCCNICIAGPHNSQKISMRDAYVVLRCKRRAKHTNCV